MKKKIVKTIKWIVLITVVFVGTSCNIQEEQQTPNLLYIFSDQHTYDMLGCYGNDQVISPNIDKLAEEGLRLNHCFSNSPTCTPYRGMLMSGRHPLYNGCFINDRPLIPGHGKKFAEVLRDAGYHTGYVGKWHLLGGERDRPIPEGAMRYGFDEFFYSNNCHVDFRPGKCFYWNKEGEKVFFKEWEVYGQTRQALGFLDGCKKQKEPFALFVSWHPPHDWGKFKGEDGRMHYKYDSIDELMKYYERDSIRVRPGMESTADLRRMYHGQMAMVTGVDIAFGRLMEKLKEIGAYENTLVVFTSDHGDMLEFAGAIVPKQYPHDYSLHVPFILRWPGKIAKGQDTDLLFGALDIMPTILGLMGLEIPRECQGKNLSDPLLTGNEDAVDFIPIWSFYNHSYKGVITKDWTYSTTKTGQSPLHSVLFDRNKDPYQLENLFESDSQQAIRDSLWEITAGWMEQFGDEFYTNEDLKALSDSAWDSNRTLLPIEVLKASR